MNEPRGERHSIDEILTAARARLDRIEPETLERDVLGWRLDPGCEHHIAEVVGYDMRIVIVCNEGYSSSLAAAQLLDLGLHRATDLITFSKTR